MKKIFKGIAALAVSMTLLPGVATAATQSQKINTNVCETVYTNYYFFQDANTVASMSTGPLNTISHSNIAEYTNNSYQISNFNPANIGYGQVIVTPTSVTSSDGITSMSLDDYYAITARANMTNGAYSAGRNNYIVSHNWFAVKNDGSQEYHTDNLNTSNYTIAQHKSATLDADSTITRQSTINPYSNELKLRIDRTYKGYLTGSPLMVNDIGWYFHPAVYYIQYCSPKATTPDPTPTPEEYYYHVAYRPGTTETVTNMPSESTHNTKNNMNISEMIPVRAGYKFLGWTTDPASPVANPSFNPGALYTDRKDLILYAVWEKLQDKPVLPDNPQTGIEDYLVPVSGVVSASGIALAVLKKKKGFKQF